MKHIFLVLFTLLSIISTIRAQNSIEGSALAIGENYRIYPSNVSQSEVFIVKHPSNDNILFSSANSIIFNPQLFVSEGIYVSTNGGNSWEGSDTCTGEPIILHRGDPGIAIDHTGRFILTRLSSLSDGVFSHYSTDNGQTWSQQVTISTDQLERAAVTTDVNSSSNYLGRTYAVWSQLTTPFSMWFSYTDNGAQSWSTSSRINFPTLLSRGGDIAIGPNGEVYVCWAGLNQVSPFNEKQVGFAVSTDGGENWTVSESAFEVNGITSILSSKGNIRVNGSPNIAVDATDGTRNGWIYIVTGEKELAPAGNDPDIVLHRSSDGGQTWSSAIRVNQDPVNNGKIQYFPAIHIDKFGAINVLFYDDRNTTSDSSGVFLARSTDGGNTWAEFEISDHNYKPQPIGGLGQGYMGDNIDLTSTDTQIWPVWMDNSTGMYQIWTVPIDFSAVDVEHETSHPLSFNLKQNYPNPFNPSTKIRFTIPTPPASSPLLKGRTEEGFVTLKVYDVLGNEVATLVNEELSPGEHEVTFYADGFPSGVYFYSLTADTFSETKKFVLLR